MHNFFDLQPYGENQQLRMIVETPCSSNIKLEYEQELRAGRLKTLASSLCQSGTIAWGNWKRLPTCPRA